MALTCVLYPQCLFMFVCVWYANADEVESDDSSLENQGHDSTLVTHTHTHTL